MYKNIQEIFISYHEHKVLLKNFKELLHNINERQLLLSSSDLYGAVIKQSFNENNLTKITSFTDDKQAVSIVIRLFVLDWCM